jgi:brefeldin A-resistance guanine nucleotide exchange factor 1
MRKLTNYRHLDLDALVAAVRASEALAHERTVARLKLESDETVQNTPYNQTHRNLEGQYVLSYDPASVFLLEIMVSILKQTPQHIEELWSVFSRLARE